MTTIYLIVDNMEMMQDNNTVSLLVDAIKTHMKVVCFLSLKGNGNKKFYSLI